MKFVVLLSGGLDSVVNLYEAKQKGEVTLALTFDYGQRAAKNEIQAARFFCEKLKAPHRVIEIPWLASITKTALVNNESAMPELKNLDDKREADESAKAVWVPNRNGVFLNIAASFAESLGAQAVIPGFNIEEAATFPDNTQAFLDQTTLAFKLSTMSQVKAISFTTQLNKTQMVGRAFELGVDLAHVWSCYQSGSQPCGRCESCQRSARGLKEFRP
ncbi:MAG: 7-cyano-7-deazaguanine synthase QueC [Oligoflexia bacterium]|nr:7-cyano-7-deazaguanine synthase QueC [Oligoflexia bacterium]